MNREARLSAEQFEALLIDIRNGASASLHDHAAEQIQGGDQHDSVVEDLRSVWHASEIALGMLKAGYVPKREAIWDAVELLVLHADSLDASGARKLLESLASRLDDDE